MKLAKRAYTRVRACGEGLVLAELGKCRGHPPHAMTCHFKDTVDASGVSKKPRKLVERGHSFDLPTKLTQHGNHKPI